MDISTRKIELIDDEGRGESERIMYGEKVLCKMNFKIYKILLDELAKDVKVLLQDDLVEYVWRDIKDLKNCKLTPPSEELFKRLGYIN